METNRSEEVDGRPALMPTGQTLKGRLVTVEALDLDKHSAELFECLCGPGADRIWRHMTFGPFVTEQELRDNLVKRQNNGDIFFAIIENSSRRAVGMCSYQHINVKDRTVELGGAMFSPTLGRTTGGTEAMYLMAKHAFDDLGYRRYEWKSNVVNVRSIRAAQRLGFTFEGIFRQHLILMGRNRDTALYSIIDKEWPLRKKALETWLSLSNFDEQGINKRSLSDLNGQKKNQQDQLCAEPDGVDKIIGEPVECKTAMRPRSIELVGRVVTIVPLDLTVHLQDLYEELCGPESDSLWLALSYGPFKQTTEFEEFLTIRSKENDSIIYCIKDNKSGKIVGLCGYGNIQTDHRVIMLRYVNFSPRLQRTTGATEAMFLLLRYAIEELGYRRIEWRSNALNQASRRAALRLGFTLEATFRQHWIIRGHINRDTYMFAIIDKEWPHIRSAFDEWLNENNFDDNGSQKQSLSTLMKANNEMK